MWMLGTINFEKNHNWAKIITQLTFTCSKLTIVTLEKGEKYVKS